MVSKILHHASPVKLEKGVCLGEVRGQSEGADKSRPWIVGATDDIRHEMMRFLFTKVSLMAV